MKRRRQIGLQFRTWGGKRKGAGRGRREGRPLVSHRQRVGIAARVPVHVTVRMLPHVWNLRSRRSFGVIGKAVQVAAARFAMRLCEFSVQGNHLHLIVEAADAPALGQGMKGLGVRLAKGLNVLMGLRGRVLADRYHAHVLRTPSEVRRAVSYVVHNHRKHMREVGKVLPETFVDEYSSASAASGLTLPRGRTWPLRDCHVPDGVGRSSAHSPLVAFL